MALLHRHGTTTTKYPPPLRHLARLSCSERDTQPAWPLNPGPQVGTTSDSKRGASGLQRRSQPLWPALPRPRLRKFPERPAVIWPPHWLETRHWQKHTRPAQYGYLLEREMVHPLWRRYESAVVAMGWRKPALGLPESVSAVRCGQDCESCPFRQRRCFRAGSFSADAVVVESRGSGLSIL